MSELETEKARLIYYHPEIINPKHRQYCPTCDMAYFLMKDLLKGCEVEKN